MNRFKERFHKLMLIFWVFCRIGPTTFGGGYAMIPVIEREIVKKETGWKQPKWGI
ncbi:chromate transporter [Paenibacillus hexagrammi]|uniref:Chromate transporter n=1 Tax=Paenibacillus hexagrammi TaxID=2908839 RepID=A0ABY3SEC2_9BACL|nr:chromate transporter [Paenibacillus sp. YPD9-1]UJF32344.1 chromate transporter [Paenibacillus sp. YPD9-1]